jgi:hypothetical protein
MAFLIGTQFQPTSGIRNSLSTPDDTFTQRFLGPPDSSGAGPEVTPAGNFGSIVGQPGVVGQPTDLMSNVSVVSTTPNGNPNPASTSSFSVTSTLSNLISTVIADVTGFVPWIILAIVLYFGYKLFVKHR